MKKILLLIVFICSIIELSSQVNKTGVPFITNYSPNEFNFAEQNWSIVQDKRGIMYFGNNDNGVLEYDGISWRKIPIPNSSKVSSLAVDDNGVIYVGASDDFGYLSPDKAGNLLYKSLISKVDSFIHIHELGDVYKVLVRENKVYFCLKNHLFIYDNNKLTHIPIQKELDHWLSFLVNNRIYLGTANKGLMEVSGDTIKQTPGGDFFKQKNITIILPFDKTEIIVGSFEGELYLFNPETGRVRSYGLSSPTESFLKANGLLCALPISGDRMVFGCLSNGLIVTDKSGSIINHLDKNNGLQDDIIYAVYMNPAAGKSSPLWLALNSGISKIEINSPFGIFNEKLGLKGQALDIIRFNNQIYVSTFQGIFRLSNDSAGNAIFIRFKEPSNAQCWAFAKFTIPGTKSEVLLVGTTDGVYTIDKYNNISKINISQLNWIDEHNKPIKIQQNYFSVFYMFPSQLNKNKIYIGEDRGLKVLTFSDGKWSTLQCFETGETRSIIESKNGDIWLGTPLKGIYRIKNPFLEPKIINYTSKDGLPEIHDANPVLEGDSIYFATYKGIYKLNEQTGKFQSSSHFGISYSDGTKGVYEIFKERDQEFWLSCISIKNNFQKVWIEKAWKNKEGKMMSLEKPFRRLPNKWVDVIYPDENNLVWFGFSDDLFCYNENEEFDAPSKFNTFIRKIYIAKDSTLFGGTFFSNPDSLPLKISLHQEKKQKTNISFKYNSIIFTFASGSFENEQSVVYSYSLKGFNENWSNWVHDSRAVFTNLDEGNYQFCVKSRSIYGVESPIETYSFRILPPWYRTIWAYLAYLLFLGLVIWTFFVQIGNIRLEKMVKFRTAEVIKQKEEIERKNKDIMASIQYAYRIQTALLPPGDYLDEIFPERFILYLPRDIVSGDFYWLTKQGQKIITVTADCTGHGVPGAMMSMLGITLLNDIISKNEELRAHEILNSLRSNIIHSFRQTGKIGETQDGMDMALYILNIDEMRLEFSGANQSLNLIRNGELQVIKGDNMPIGISAYLERSFISHDVSLVKGDMIYTFSDGYHDQFGGPLQKKMLVFNLRRLLTEIHQKPLEEQKEILHNHFINWKGEGFQVDDITIIGVRV